MCSLLAKITSNRFGTHSAMHEQKREKRNIWYFPRQIKLVQNVRIYKCVHHHTYDLCAVLGRCPIRHICLCSTTQAQPMSICVCVCVCAVPHWLCSCAVRTCTILWINLSKSNTLKYTLFHLLLLCLFARFFRVHMHRPCEWAYAYGSESSACVCVCVNWLRFHTRITY